MEGFKTDLSGEVTGLKQQLLTMQTQLISRHSLDKLPSPDDFNKRITSLENELKQTKLDTHLCQSMQTNNARSIADILKSLCST